MAEKKAVKKQPEGRFKLYEKSGETVKSKNRHCPKCGPGFCLASHKDRLVCGKCGYLEVVKS
jgi:small subunit ribosomal protein S27Ae